VESHGREGNIGVRNSGAVTAADDKFAAALALFMAVQIPLFLVGTSLLATYGDKIFRRH